MYPRRFLHTVSIFAVLLTLPIATLAQTNGATVILQDAPSVSRADFLRAGIQSLHITLQNKVQLQYRRPVPVSLQPYVKTALYYKAIPFGKDLNLGQTITRGHAVYLLSHLKQLTPTHEYTGTYQDVIGDNEMRDAIQISIEHQWLKPESASMFGVDSVLSGAEALSLLKVASEDSASSGQSSSVPALRNGRSRSSVPTITIHLGTKKQTKNLPLPDQDMLQAVWQLLNDQYLYIDKIKEKEAAYGAAEAIVQSLNDPYTTFLRPVPAKAFQDQIGGQITGIGAQVEYKENILVIVAPLSGSPAEKAGLKSGDLILKANDEDITHIGFIQAVGKIRGPKGTTVKLLINRNGTEMFFTVTRDTINVPEIDISFQGAIAVVKISQFGETTDRELRANLKKVQDQKPKGIILDLRNNPGGLLHAADTVVSNFLTKGSVVSHILARAGESVEVTADEPTIDASIPLVVLVNKGSASAAEITAGALQDYKRATIVGEQTFGKGTVQQILEFRDGSEIKMTIAEWLTPLRRKINGIGVTPDIVVSASENRDDQMLKALDILR